LFLFFPNSLLIMSASANGSISDHYVIVCLSIAIIKIEQMFLLQKARIKKQQKNSH
jgi:hypothetical protein